MKICIVFRSRELFALVPEEEVVCRVLQQELVEELTVQLHLDREETGQQMECANKCPWSGL